MLVKPKMNPGYGRLGFPCLMLKKMYCCCSSGGVRWFFPGELDANGWTLADVVLVHLYVASMDDFAPLNAVYRKHFGTNPPAR